MGLGLGLWVVQLGAWDAQLRFQRLCLEFALWDTTHDKGVVLRSLWNRLGRDMGYSRKVASFATVCCFRFWTLGRDFVAFQPSVTSLES